MAREREEPSRRRRNALDVKTAFLNAPLCTVEESKKKKLLALEDREEGGHQPMEHAGRGGEGGSKPKGAFGSDATPTDPGSIGLGSRGRDVDG